MLSVLLRFLTAMKPKIDLFVVGTIITLIILSIPFISVAGQTYIDTEAIAPWYFKFNIHEGGSIRFELTDYQGLKNPVTAKAD